MNRIGDMEHGTLATFRDLPACRSFGGPAVASNRGAALAMRLLAVLLASGVFDPDAAFAADGIGPATGPTTAPSAPAADTTPQGSGAPRRTGRIAPSELSTAEIREQADRQYYPQDFGGRLDRTHDWLYVNAQEFVESTDRHFARRDTDLLPVPATPFQLGLVTETIDRTDRVEFELDLKLDITLKLPNIERRLRIFITNDDVAEAPNRVAERGNVRAGVRFNPARALDFDIGLKLDLPPVAFASLRWSTFQPFGNWEFYPFAKLFAETDEGLGASAGFTVDRRIGQATLARSSSYAKWRNDRDATEWTQVLLLARAEELLQPERYGRLVESRDLARAWGLQALATGSRASAVERYEASVFYKRPLRRRWLYLFVEPLVRWDRRYDWRADPGIRIGFDALFWSLAGSAPDAASDQILLRPPADRP